MSYFKVCVMPMSLFVILSRNFFINFRLEFCCSGTKQNIYKCCAAVNIDRLMSSLKITVCNDWKLFKIEFVYLLPLSLSIYAFWPRQLLGSKIKRCLKKYYTKIIIMKILIIYFFTKVALISKI